MKPIYILSKSTRKDKKMMITTPDNRKIHFGASGYEDYLTHKSKERRNNYILRHQKNEDWTDPETAGFWAKHLLWGNSPNLNDNIQEIERDFNIKIIMK